MAEIGSAFLCAELGITLNVREDHAAYIALWLQVLKDDKRRFSPPPAMPRRPPISLLGGGRPRRRGA